MYKLLAFISLYNVHQSKEKKYAEESDIKNFETTISGALLPH
jgi:hypothetical protein